MKYYYFVLAVICFNAFINTTVVAQEYPYSWMDGTGEEGGPFEPQIEFRGIECLSDIQVFPSSNYQSEESIALNQMELNNLLIGANVKVPEPPSFNLGYYYSFDGGYNWEGDDFLPGTGNTRSDPAVAKQLSSNFIE